MPKGSPYILASVVFSQLEAVKKEDYLWPYLENTFGALWVYLYKTSSVYALSQIIYSKLLLTLHLISKLKLLSKVLIETFNLTPHMVIFAEKNFTAPFDPSLNSTSNDVIHCRCEESEL